MISVLGVPGYPDPTAQPASQAALATASFPDNNRFILISPKSFGYFFYPALRGRKTPNK
jgi:hypothetical protein